VSETAAALRTELDGALAKRDRAAAVGIATRAVASDTIDIASLYTDVLIPLMVDTGSQWQQGTTSVWEEHFATATVRTIVDALYPAAIAAAASAASRDDSVVLACPPQEAHDLGLRMLSDRFEIAGWQTYYLGADTPVAEIVDAATRLNADLVVVSASTHYNRVLLRAVVDDLREGLPDARVVAGGAAFVGDCSDWPEGLLFDERIIAEGPDAPGVTCD
jgi:methanogenic corrinoid protein MtbC1